MRHRSFEHLKSQLVELYDTKETDRKNKQNQMDAYKIENWTTDGIQTEWTILVDNGRYSDVKSSAIRYLIIPTLYYCNIIYIPLS